MSLRVAKQDEMRNNGSFNHHANTVSAEIFSSSSFFDSHDVMQVKYEMLRSVERECNNISSAAEKFGFSRVSFYQIKKEFDKYGVSGLMPKKRGPKGSRKLDQDDIEFARSLTGTHTKTQILMRLIEDRGVDVSKRTLERQLSVKKNL
jgi:transposase